MKRLTLSLVLLCSLCLLTPRVALAAPSPSAETLLEVYQHLLEKHYRQPSEEALLEAAIAGMLDALQDPYTQYMSAAEYADFLGGINQSYGGIGVTLGLDDAGDAMIILNVFMGAPADLAGLQAGDRILAVNGVQVTAEKWDESVSALRGPVDTEVAVTVQRGAESPETHKLVRAQVELASIDYTTLPSGLGYISVLSMGEETGFEFYEAVIALEAEEVPGLIVDVRGNGGGFVVAGIELADLFLSEGRIFVFHDAGETIELHADEYSFDLPLVVLVDENTASSAEIFAGALQKNGRALLVGATTFGKGTMQEPVELRHGGFLKVSVDRWELADGSHTDGVGLTPDVSVANPALVLAAAEQLLLPETPSLAFSVNGGVLFQGRLQDGAPELLLRDGKAYLPLRYLFETLGGELTWSAADRAAVVTYGEHQVTARPFSGTLEFGAETMEGALLLHGGSTYVQLDALVNLPGLSASADDFIVTVSR